MDKELKERICEVFQDESFQKRLIKSVAKQYLREALTNPVELKRKLESKNSPEYNVTRQNRKI